MLNNKTNANKVTAQRFGDIEAGSDITQAIGSVIIVKWHIKIRCDHGDMQSA